MAVVIVLVVLGLMAFGAIVLVSMFAFSRAEKKNKKRAPEILDGLFDGSNAVSYTTTLTGPRYDEVVLGGKARGYRLESTSGKDRYGCETLIFVKE